MVLKVQFEWSKVKIFKNSPHGRNDSFRLGCLIVPFLQASTTFLTEITYVKAF